MEKSKVITGADKYFNLPAGCYCGLVLEKKLAIRVQKLLTKQAEELKELIGSRIDEAHVSSWTLAYPNGEQTTVNYTSSVENTLQDKKYRLKLLQSSQRITALDHFYFVESSSYSDARNAAAENYEELYSADDKEVQ